VVSMGNMPDMPRNVMTFCSCQVRLSICVIFGLRWMSLLAVYCFRSSSFGHFETTFSSPL
jgi:hypothetical protein